MQKTITIPIAEASDRQLLLAILRAQNRIETQMTNLTTAVDDLKASVDGVAQRLLPQIETLRAEVDADNAAAVAAVDAIEVEVNRLNGLGADPTTPVDPAPVDPIDPPAVDPTV